MSEAKFTKGEWLGFKGGRWQSDDINDYILDGDNNPSWVDITCNGQAVAIVPNHGDTLDDNAHLVASAPKMYEMLNRWVNSVECVDDNYQEGLKEETMDLLAKARGEK